MVVHDQRRSVPVISRRRRSPNWLVATLLVAISCSPSVPPPNGVAIVDGEILEYEEFEDFLARNSTPDTGALGSDVLSDLFDRFLEQKILARWAIQSLDLDAATDARSAVAELLARADTAPDAATVSTYYRQNQTRFELSERVLLRQLLFTDREEATRVRDLWVDGLPYEILAEQLKTEPMVTVGREGEFALEDLPKAFADVLAGLEEGEISNVIAADYGFHLFQKLRHLPARTLSVSEASPLIIEELSHAAREDWLERLVTQARERYNVQVFERNLPFAYLGSYRTDETEETPD